MRSSDGGFTLIEVLGAVAILAILYTTLSTVAIQGLRSEGESRRMLEASLLADWELSEFELELQTGAAPEIGITRSEEQDGGEQDGGEQDGFTVTWEVTPLQTEIFMSRSAQEQDANASNPVGQNAPVPTGQVGAAGDGAVPFLQVDLRISWFEAENERSVTRTIFAVDEDAAVNLARASVLNEGAVEGEQP